MTALFPFTPIPNPEKTREVDHSIRVINQNFRQLSDFLNRAVAAGSLIADGSVTLAMLATAAKTLSGDVTGLTTATVVGKIQGKAVPAPVAGDDLKSLVYNHGTTAFIYAARMADPFTTRGDLVYRNATAPARLAVGTVNQILKSDGTDPGWGSLSSVIDGALGSTQGMILYRGAAGWSALGTGTSGWFLKTQGAAADPIWASVAGSSPLTTKGDIYGFSTVDARLPVGTDGQVLTADAASTLGIKWAAAGGYSPPVTTKGDLFIYGAASTDRLAVGSDNQVLIADSAQAKGLKWGAVPAATSVILDSTVHTDTLTGTVVRGDLIYGNSTPKWARLAIGTVGKDLHSDGTGVAWKRPCQVRADRPTPVMTYFQNGVATNNGPLTRTDAGGSGVTAETTDTERPCVKFTQTVNTGTAGSSWSTLIKAQHSPAMWADFKQVSFSKQGLMVGFNSNGLSGSGPYAGAPHCCELGWLDGTDTNYQVGHATGAAPTKSDTGVAKDTNWHDVLIYTPDAGVTWKCELDGVEVYSGTTNLPTVTTAMAPVQGISCTGTGSTGNELRVSYCVVQCAKSITT